ncbi:phosphatidylinositol glycan anchor biosynthesis class U protein-like [Penaeus monodon]|uniref:phosphatidylinositol glycan anchor biosynthesis class U protein-like n=1 Tax=Penaeus monodon TaxID=6687 RepID=UPI0018A77D98|nr:phosphatidylinositol glycan anchor biosynthesis class U protein-like [Penaeus monodon]
MENMEVQEAKRNTSVEFMGNTDAHIHNIHILMSFDFGFGINVDTSLKLFIQDFSFIYLYMTPFFFFFPGYPMIFGTLVALVAYQSFYPICLMVPGILFFMQNDSHNLKAALLKPLLSFLVSLGLLMVISAEIAGGWEFLEATYGFILAAPDLTPNIGLFWYFFTEMFEHFRLFFLATFQINAFVYVLPLAIRLRKDPVLLATALLAFTAVFRSYPALGDVGIYLSLLPMWKHLYPFMRQTFIVGCMFVATSVLGPIMYNLWIFSGSANANFYFAVTLAFNTAQIFLVTDLLFAHVKREYHLIHGSKMEVDEVPARLILQ